MSKLINSCFSLISDSVFAKLNSSPVNSNLALLNSVVEDEYFRDEKSQISLTDARVRVPDIEVGETIDTEVKSEFIAKGINQTLHRIYVNFECYVTIITPLKNYKKKITNQVIIAEHIIVGNIPDSYYNLEGMNGVDDALNVID